MKVRPLTVLSHIYRIWAGVCLEDSLQWQERCVHQEAYGEAVWGVSPIPAAQPVALFARLAQEFSCADYGISISVGFL